MKRYQVVLETTASAYITVEAEDPDAAIEEAFEMSPGLCAQCSGWGQQDVSMDLGEWEVPQEADGSDADYFITEAES